MWQAVQSRQPHSGWAMTGISRVPRDPASVMWQPWQSEPGGIAMPMGESAMSEFGVADGSTVGAGVGAGARTTLARSGPATTTRNDPTPTMPNSRAAIATGNA